MVFTKFLVFSYFFFFPTLLKQPLSILTVHAAVPFLRPLGVTRLREFLFEFRSLLSADDTMHQIMKRVPGNAPQLSQGFPHTPPSPSGHQSIGNTTDAPPPWDRRPKAFEKLFPSHSQVAISFLFTVFLYFFAIQSANKIYFPFSFIKRKQHTTREKKMRGTRKTLVGNIKNVRETRKAAKGKAKQSSIKLTLLPKREEVGGMWGCGREKFKAASDF